MMIELKNSLEAKWDISLAMADFAQDVTLAQLTAVVQQQAASQPEREPLHESAKEAMTSYPLAITDAPRTMPIVPTQHWFLEMNYDQSHHWNVSALLEVLPDLDPLLLQQAFHYNLIHHEALRVRFHKDSTGWQQVINPPDPMLPFLQVDLSMLPDEMKSAAVEAKAAELQSTLNFTQGPILRLVHFNFGKQQAGRLLLIVHHLILDAFAFRLFVGDLFTVYLQLAQKQAMRLPPKKISYSTYVQRMVERSSCPWRMFYLHHIEHTLKKHGFVGVRSTCA